MRLKNIVIALTVSLVFLISRVSFADTLEMTGMSGQSVDYEFVYPYIFAYTGPYGSNGLVI